MESGDEVFSPVEIWFPYQSAVGLVTDQAIEDFLCSALNLESALCLTRLALSLGVAVPDCYLLIETQDDSGGISALKIKARSLAHVPALAAFSARVAAVAHVDGPDDAPTVKRRIALGLRAADPLPSPQPSPPAPPLAAAPLIPLVAPMMPESTDEEMMGVAPPLSPFLSPIQETKSRKRVREQEAEDDGEALGVDGQPKRSKRLRVNSTAPPVSSSPRASSSSPADLVTPSPSSSDPPSSSSAPPTPPSVPKKHKGPKNPNVRRRLDFSTQLTGDELRSIQLSDLLESVLAPPLLLGDAEEGADEKNAGSVLSSPGDASPTLL